MSTPADKPKAPTFLGPAPVKKLQAQEPFEEFIARMVNAKKVTRELLDEILGKDMVNRILDNSNNQMGIAVTNESGTPILTGQLHESLGAIPDLKARIAQLIEDHETEEHHEVAAHEKQEQKKIAEEAEEDLLAVENELELEEEEEERDSLGNSSGPR